MNPVLETTRYVMENSDHVKINMDRLHEFSDNFRASDSRHWLADAPFDLATLSVQEKLHFLFVFNSINFCYWGEPKWTLTYKNKKYDGAWGMVVAFGRAIEEGKSLLDSSYLATLSNEELSYLFRGNVPIPLFGERLDILREIGSTLNERFGGSFSSIINAASNDALLLLELIVKNFPSFADISYYKDQKIFFYKRAQLLVSDIYNLFEGRGFGELKNIEKLTAFADYKIPQVLRKAGILVYSEELAGKVDQMKLIPGGSPEEIEIRANTIWAVELIAKRLNGRNLHIEPIYVNDHLWLLGQNKSPDDLPYHRTRTIYY
ncbi:MAG: queuosine salvage family protein [Candidatus Thermoplasmatota archaeon]|nr:queuosine salvage family protein [Candidatus Thermoplasmatota archaeon]